MPEPTERQLHLLEFFGLLQDSPSVSTYENRLLLQKKICFYKYAGVPFDYSFNWYIRGPYSPALAADAFSLPSTSEQGSAVPSVFTPEQSDLITRIKTEFGDLLNTEHDAELYASLVFLKYDRKIAGDQDLKSIMLLLKPKYTPQEVDVAIKKLSDSGLFP